MVGGTGAGIQVAGSQTNVAIRNGTVRSWSNTGVFTFFAKNTQLERLAVSANGGGGISAGNNTTVLGCTAASNSSVGILVLDGSLVKDCAAQSNTGIGFQANSGCTVSDCSASSNQGGIQVGEGSTVNGCTARGNTQHGITTTGSSTVSGCTSPVPLNERTPCDEKEDHKTAEAIQARRPRQDLKPKKDAKGGARGDKFHEY